MLQMEYYAMFPLRLSVTANNEWVINLDRGSATRSDRTQFILLACDRTLFDRD